jgi:D-alanyl-lipoteichoic acid acyltransferase DltB (MBOAT superfamily)
MSYTIDVYRKRVDPTHSLIEVAAYVSFFPQLVAGPIERAGRLLHQFRRKRTVTADMLSSGALLIALGFFKKLAIADAVAPYATRAFSSVQTAPWHMLVTGAWFFAIQIYCDFSAYSDIARGVARLLGFNLMVNFNQPYFSTSITEFWRRWHISLSTWLRDYLYIPLGGNRCGRIRSLLNVIITMILGGLWHGANWTFLLWGTLHGCYVVIHRLMLRGRKLPAASGTRGTGFRLKCFIKGLLTFHLVLLAWIVFRCTSLAETWQYMTGLVSLRNIQQLDMLLYYRLAFFILLLLFIDIPQYRNRCHEAMLSWHWAFRGVAIGVMIVLTILLAPSNETPFVYFQF